MSHEGDGEISDELSQQLAREEFFHEIAELHKTNQTTPTICGIELEERMRDYASIRDEYNARIKNDVDGKETEFIEALEKKLERYSDYLENLQAAYEREFDVAQGVTENDGTPIHAPEPKSFTHPGNLTLN